MAGSRALLFSLLALAILSQLASAHDILSTPATACTDGPNGFGPYINWTLWNDYSVEVTLTLTTATSEGPSGWSTLLAVYGSPGYLITNVLQPISASGTTTITADPVWTDKVTIPNWSASTNLQAPNNCQQCTATDDGQACGAASNTICQANQCSNSQCVLQDVATDAKCPAKQGAAQGMPLCTQQMCVNGACSSNQPYAGDTSCLTQTFAANVVAACNVHACVGTSCITAPWYYPAASATGTAPSCTDTGGHAPQCWQSACTVDLTQNTPYGLGVCGGTAVNISPQTCPPPTAPNGATVNSACYVPACATGGTGMCSTTFLSGTGGTDATQHLGNCPVPTQYSSQCYWPYCDANGQCTGDILSGTNAPNYTAGWMPNATPCPVPTSFDAQCYLPACVNGVCGGFPQTGSINLPGLVSGSCPVPSGFNAACYVPGCINGKCSGFPITGNASSPGMLANQICPVPAGYDAACYVPGCIAGQCQGFPVTGSVALPGILPGFTCSVPSGYDAACYVASCINGKCSGYPLSGNASSPGMLPNQTCAVPAGFDATCYIPGCIAGQCQGFPITGTTTSPGFLNASSPCTVPAQYNAQCWAPFCNDGTCAGAPVNAGLPCTPDPEEIVVGYSADCVVYNCATATNAAGKCVPTLLPMNTSCNSSGTPPNGCIQEICVLGVCSATAANIGQPCSGTGQAPTCNNFLCVLSNTTQLGDCLPVPLSVNSFCETDVDLCTTQSCDVDPLTGLGICIIVANVSCANYSTNFCDPGKCNPNTGTCQFSPLPDATPCSSNDTYCSNYSCWSGQCLRMCSCGNGMLDKGETCDWGQDLWCPPIPVGSLGTSEHCPDNVEPGNYGYGNHLGLNDTLSSCNLTTCLLSRVPDSAKKHPTGLSKAVLAGIICAIIAGLCALALAGFLICRAGGGGSGAGPAGSGADNAAGDSNTNPLYSSNVGNDNPLFQD